jgi:hypothetical protein
MFELLKLIPYIWPAIRELVIGSKNHPYFKNRAKVRFSKLITTVCLIIIGLLGDLTYTLHTEKIELQKQLDASKKVVVDNSEQIKLTHALTSCNVELNEHKLNLTNRTEIELKQIAALDQTKKQLSVVNDLVQSCVAQKRHLESLLRTTQRKVFIDKLDQLNDEGTP